MYLLLPDLYLFFYHQNLNLILMSFWVLVYLFAVLKTTKYSFLLFPFLALVPSYLYYISIYHVGINEQILSIVLETNFQEAIQFLGANIYIYLFAYFLWLIFCIYICYKNYYHPKVWCHWSRYLLLALGTLYFLTGYSFNATVVNEVNAAFGSSGNNFLVEEENSFLMDLKQTYPLGLVISSYNLAKEQKKINQAFEKNKNFKFYAQQQKKIEDKEVYVLVIGETSRRENWQLNGYKRKTNPSLSQQKNLVNFEDMLSISSETRSSLPMILTRKLEKNIYRYDFPEKSMISAFKEAGFKTYWLSTQQKIGAFDSSTSVYAKEADKIIFLNRTSYKDAGVVDDVLIPEFKKIITSDEKKQFIVIHTLGSHYNYVHRYPQSFDHFKPSLMELKNYSLQDQVFQKQLLNSYDNSILYTDYVLNQFINLLDKQINTASFLLYSSDHGEDLFDQGCSKSGHGLETVRNFEIASFAWYSNDYQDLFFDKIEKIKLNRERKVNQTAIFPTLLDAANISIKDDLLQRSLLKKFNDYPRFVLGGINYDNAKIDGLCREIK